MPMQYVPNRAYEKLLEKNLKDKLGDIILLGIYAYLGRAYGHQAIEGLPEEENAILTKDDLRKIIEIAEGREIADEEKIKLLENTQLP